MKESGEKSEPLREGDIIEEVVKRINQPDAIVRYRRGRMLGRGAFGHCYQILNLESNVKSAVKIISKESLAKLKVKSQVVSEIQIHRELQHENIVRIEQAFEDKQNIYIKMQLCLNKNLNGLLKKRKFLTEQETKYFVHQLACVLVYLRKNRILHRDLKLNNLFLGHKMEVKVGDFGLAVKLTNIHEKRRSICGTPNFIAPEILDEKPYSYEVDIWSTGIIMFALLYGRPPFESQSIKQTYELIKIGQLRIPSKEGVSLEAKDLISRMLERDISRRITPDEMLAHEFFKPSIPKMLPITILAAPPTEFFYEPVLNHPTDQQKCNELKKLNLLKLVEIISTSPSTSASKSKSDSGESDGTDRVNANQSTDQTDKKQSIKGTNSEQIDRTIDENKQQCRNIRIIQWADYTHKYGIGYLLSNGNVGVIFNDSSIMTVDVKNEYYHYITKSAHQNEVVQLSASVPVPNRDLGKKIAIVSHFKNFFQKDIENGLADSQSQDLIYVSKLRRTAHSTLFRLSNKLIQVLFTDKSEIVIPCKTQNKMVYINPKGQHFYEPLSTALKSKNGELVNRLAHTKELVKSLISDPIDKFR